jgi:hypothetical protein
MNMFFLKLMFHVKHCAISFSCADYRPRLSIVSRETISKIFLG